MSSNLGGTRRLVGISIFTAIVVVLQLVATFVKLGPFAITLALTPIVVGAALYGTGAGAFLGGAFGLVVLVASVTGGDPGGYIMWSAWPFMTLLLIMVKGVAAGFCAGLAYRAASKRNAYGGVILAALVSPVVNTGVFLLGTTLFYRELLIEWAGGTSLVYYIIFGLTGVNFLVEVGVNMVLSPVVARIIRIGKKELKA